MGSQLSYGFAPNIIPSSVPNAYHEQPSHLSEPRFHIGWSIGGDNVPSPSSSQDETVTDAIQRQTEIPCQAIRVPDEDMPIYSWRDYRTVRTCKN